MHPLSGANPATFWAVTRRGGGVPRRKLGDLALAGAAVLGRWPFTVGERICTARRLERVTVRPPVFILGHWRSGTTHLYNILSKAEFGYVPPLATGLPWELLSLVRWLRPWLEKTLPEDRFIDRIPVTPDSPQEDEVALANMIPLSFFHGIYFPKRFEEHFNRGVFFDGCTEDEIRAWQKVFRYFLAKLTVYFDGRPLLIKNPVYTARLAMLRAMMPEARFIHIVRNPFDVFPSTRSFYARMLEELALQDHGHIDIEPFILDTYERMMDRLIADAATVPADRLVELRYEDLARDPLGAVEHVYRGLGLDGLEAARPRFEAYADSVRAYRKNRYTRRDEAAAVVERRWGRYLEHWGYERPGVPDSGAAAG